MTQIKICGVREVNHAVSAARLGADFIGMVFAESRRKISHDQAAAIADAMRRLGKDRPRVVGVFTDMPSVEVNKVAESLGLDMVQLSGGEKGANIEDIHLPVIRTIHVGPSSKGTKGLKERLAALSRLGVIPLLDTSLEGQLGGTGMPFDWSLAAEQSQQQPFLMAGGLTPENVASAIAQVQPWGVDVSSGVETDGVKDPKKIQTFIRSVKEASG